MDSAAAYGGDVVLFGRRIGEHAPPCARAYGCRGCGGIDIGGGGGASGALGGIHMAIVPVPHRGQWTAECGRTMPSSDGTLSVVHGATIVDNLESRACWLPPGVFMEDVCYKCMRRAGAVRVIGKWRDAPPPTMECRMPQCPARVGIAVADMPRHVIRRRPVRRL